MQVAINGITTSAKRMAKLIKEMSGVEVVEISQPICPCDVPKLNKTSSRGKGVKRQRKLDRGW